MINVAVETRSQPFMGTHVANSAHLEIEQEMVMVREAHLLSLSVLVFVHFGAFQRTGLRFQPHVFGHQNPECEANCERTWVD